MPAPVWELLADIYPLKIAAPAKQGSPHYLKFFNVHVSVHMAFNLRYVCDFVTKFCQQQTEVIQNLT
jgi:hypothetical protein